MNQELTKDQIDQICVSMRVIDLVKSDPRLLEENEQLRVFMEDFCENVARIFNLVSDEQRDMILEEHQLQVKQMWEIIRGNMDKKKSLKR